MTTALEFDAWYRAERPKVLAALTAITGSEAVASEATDEAFTRAVERWNRVRSMESPGGWVNRTALNVARRRLRREGHERRLLRTVAATADHAPPPSWPIELWDGLRHLPPRELEAIVLRYVADLTVQDVAAAMGTTAGTAGSTLHAARLHLAARLTTPPDEPAAPVAPVTARAEEPHRG